MTKKHFVAIAAAFKRQQQAITLTNEEHRMLKAIALELCAAFKAVNPLFDKARFMAACGFRE